MIDYLKDPKNRVKAALWLFFGSLILMVVNVGLYALGLINDSILLLITLILSWLAITLTAVDILVSTDIRKEQE
jgi:hypothetical protein